MGLSPALALTIVMTLGKLLNLFRYQVFVYKIRLIMGMT